jgi:hypothetical protein
MLSVMVSYGHLSAFFVQRAMACFCEVEMGLACIARGAV